MQQGQKTTRTKVAWLLTALVFAVAGIATWTWLR
jgi:hypothetical protein